MLAQVSVRVGYMDDQLFKSAGLWLVGKSAYVWNMLYQLWAGSINKLFIQIGRNLKRVFMLLFKFDYSAQGDERFQTFSTSNIDFDLYIILIVVGAVLATSLLFIF
jgi:hypothetical protein